MQVTDLVIPVSTLKFIRLEEGGGGGHWLPLTVGRKLDLLKKYWQGGRV